MPPRPSSRALVARRAVAAAGFAAVFGGALGAAPASAAPVSLTLNYTCNFPLLPPEPLTLKIESEIPATATVGTSVGRLPIKASAQVSAGAAFGLRAVEATTIEGTAVASATLSLPTGLNVPLAVSTTVEKTNIPTEGGFTTNATGSTPPVTFPSSGTTNIKVNDLVLTLTPRLSDGTKSGLDEFETECALVAGQDNKLASIVVSPRGSADTVAPTQPAALSAIANASGAALSWSPSTDAVGVTGYDVYQDGVKVQTVTGTSATVGGLSASKTYKFKVQARDAAGNLSPFSDEIDVTPTAPAASGYAIAGSARVRTLTTGVVPIKGAFDAPIAEGPVAGNLQLDPVRARLMVLGFIPVSAQLQFVTNGQTTGNLSGDVLTTNSKIRTKIPQVSLFGTIPLAGGTTCQTRSISSVDLKSTNGFSPSKGGTIAGTFAISDLAGCGVLNGIVSPLTAGGGNTLSLSMTPKSVS